MVGSLFSWKSLFTNRNTREDYTISQSARMTSGINVACLSYCCFTKEDELYAAAWLGRCCLRHPERNVRVEDRLSVELSSASVGAGCSKGSRKEVLKACK